MAKATRFQNFILACGTKLIRNTRSVRSVMSVMSVKKSKVFQAVRSVNFPKLKKAKVFQAVQLGNFPACQPLQLRLRSIGSIAWNPHYQLSNLSLKILDFAQGQASLRSSTRVPRVHMTKFRNCKNNVRKPQH